MLFSGVLKLKWRQAQPTRCYLCRWFVFMCVYIYKIKTLSDSISWGLNVVKRTQLCGLCQDIMPSSMVSFYSYELRTLTLDIFSGFKLLKK